VCTHIRIHICVHIHTHTHIRTRKQTKKRTLLLAYLSRAAKKKEMGSEQSSMYARVEKVKAPLSEILKSQCPSTMRIHNEETQ
jgi:hypothetical protein